ncbi:site-specific integrase [Pseudonocardia oroxyli]|uniref:Site-specific recombinase XerD n=1 Tax=Pseudonocardia oroxyli TaxID=366584 RepID=A0A1G7QUM8_PSEOR|nr:site-specific integrase [Pseudonocardia oroxyli]SDG02226.1 Site-specific recombinase XerD [Pseudonocardia oroxyli]
MTKRAAPIAGITVSRRGSRWHYRLELEPDPLTGKRQRENKGGFETEDDAWESAVASKQRHGTGRAVAPARRTVRSFMADWLASVEESIKPTTRQNYADYIRAYVDPIIGDRRLQDVTVPVLNLLYQRLLAEGRVKVDKNTAMYLYWSERRDQREGLGPAPADLVEACGVTIHAARAAVLRFRRGRVPVETSAGLAPKTVKNVHRMLHRAFSDAVAWDYLVSNPAVHARLPRQKRTTRTRPTPWTVDELTAWLRLALSDRFAAVWLLAATTGMRRSELAGVDRDLLDLDDATLTIEDTRVVVAGQTVDSDGKSASGVRMISLDAFTVELLRGYLAMLDAEAEAFGTGYDTSHRKLLRYEDGRMLHADTITRRFNRLVDLAGVRRIRLHDVRHTYATLSLDSGVHSKIVSDRIGHAREGITVQIYGHRSTGHDREAAELVAKLIRQRLSEEQP